MGNPGSQAEWSEARRSELLHNHSFELAGRQAGRLPAILPAAKEPSQGPGRAGAYKASQIGPSPSFVAAADQQECGSNVPGRLGPAGGKIDPHTERGRPVTKT